MSDMDHDIVADRDVLDESERDLLEDPVETDLGHLFWQQLGDASRNGKAHRSSP